MARIKTGMTSPDDWQAYADLEGTECGIFVDVDTNHAGFEGVPHYVTSLRGDGHHWVVTGVNALYNVSETGFRLYLRWSDRAEQDDSELPNPLTCQFAKEMNWVIQWSGIEGNE